MKEATSVRVEMFVTTNSEKKESISTKYLALKTK